VLTYGDFGLFNVIRHKCDSDVCELRFLFTGYIQIAAFLATFFSR
jgi:hypothetical protein